MISYIMYDTENKDKSLATYAKTLQRTTMRKHTKGGYQNVVDDMREQINKYMTTVLQEEPVDPTLVDFDDTMAW